MKTIEVLTTDIKVCDTCGIIINEGEKRIVHNKRGIVTIHHLSCWNKYVRDWL